MTDTYTPDESIVREFYVEAAYERGTDPSEGVREFDRFIARIKAEALRGLAAEVADALKGEVSARQGSRMQYAVGLMTARANRIEKDEAGL